MLKHMTRSKLIVMWLAAVAVIVALLIAFGIGVTWSTGALLAAMSLVPPLLVMMLWPTGGPETMAEVLRDSEGRP